MKDKLIEIGYISKAHGIRGDLILTLLDGEASFLSVGEKVFVGREAFFIKSIKPHKDSFLLSLENLTDRNQAEILRGKKCFVSAEVFQDADDLYLNQILNYKFCVGKKIYGFVCGFASTAAHEILRVEGQDSKILEIPYVPHFITEVDHLKKTVYAEVPKELLDPDFLSASKKEDEP